MQKTITKIFVITLLFSSLVFSNDLDDIKKRGELRHLGIPYANFISGSGDGLSIEVMKGFAKYLGVDYKYVPSDWSNVLGHLTGQNARNSQNGAVFLNKIAIKGDVIANGLTILDWRKEVVNFSIPTFPSGVWLIARADSKLKPIKPSNNILKDIKVVKSYLDGKDVLALEDSCLDPKLYDLNKTKANILLQEKNIKLNELVPAIMTNAAETTLLDVPDALIALDKWPGQIKVIGPISQNQNMAVAFRKESPILLSEFNKYFIELKKDGTYHELIKKYYPDIFQYYGDFFLNE